MENIVSLIRKQSDLCFMKGAHETEIRHAEKELGLQFAEEYRSYVAAFGAVSFGCHELTGVCEADRLNVVTATATERRRNAVPGNWYVLEQTNIDGIVIWQASDGTVYITMPGSDNRKLCSSFLEYIKMEFEEMT